MTRPRRSSQPDLKVVPPVAAVPLAAASSAVSLPEDVAVQERDPAADLYDKAGPSKQRAESESFDEPVFAPIAEALPARPAQLAAKRLFDVGFSLAALTAGAPLLAGIAVAVKLDSKGPVLYRQVRVGKDGKLFDCLKFRSMVVDAEKSGPQWARNFDTRVTKVGGILRRTSLDELPQIWNILMGDMSWIGPRPERPVFVARFRKQFESYDLRHAMRPGLSGWAQVNGLRGNVSIADRTVFDVYYVRHFSLLLDAKIFVRTFAAVVAGE